MLSFSCFLNGYYIFISYFTHWLWRQWFQSSKQLEVHPIILLLFFFCIIFVHKLKIQQKRVSWTAKVIPFTISKSHSHGWLLWITQYTFLDFSFTYTEILGLSWRKVPKDEWRNQKNGTYLHLIFLKHIWFQREYKHIAAEILRLGGNSSCLQNSLESACLKHPHPSNFSPDMNIKSALKKNSLTSTGHSGLCL
jgi:hypothetical protein